MITSEKKSNKKVAVSFLIKIKLLILLVIASSCNPEEWQIIDCSECFQDPPQEAVADIKLTIDNINTAVDIEVYSGKIEEGILLISETVTTPRWQVTLPVGEYYTIAAAYRAGTGSFNITAIDGNLINVQRVRTRCDEPCWVIRGNRFNVELRY